MEFTLSTAREYAEDGRIEEWVHTYLNSGDWANLSLSIGLRRQHRWWLGPVEMPLDLLVRAAGPELNMEYVFAPDHWDKRVNQIVDTLKQPSDLPPLIAEYRRGTYSLRDGSHRHEALRRRGYDAAWVIIWYNTAEEYERDRSRLT